VPLLNYINVHTHHKPRLVDETVIRNAFHKLDSAQIEALPYWVSVGIHPWHIQQIELDYAMDQLTELALLPNVKAIGEIGIDRTITTPIHLQQRYFDAQLTVARAVNKPVIIHAVRSYSDILPYQKKSKVPFIYHGFKGNLQQATEIVKHGGYFSFGAALFEPTIERVFESVNNAHFFLETDTARHLNIFDVYRKAAELKKMSEEEIIHLQRNNFTAVFQRQ
jgi:TatD DNase family protein